MRFALILALVIAVAAVGFAIQNPGEMEVRIASYTLLGSKALVLLVTFAIGTLVGILAAAPGRWAASRRAKKLEKELHAAPASPPVTAPVAADNTAATDPYTERFGPPPHQI